MAGSPKGKLDETTGEELSDERELYLRDGRKVVVGEQGGDQVVEIRAESGMVELRIKMTEQGPVLQLESVKLQLKAHDEIEIESKRIAIKATEKLELTGGDVDVKSETEVDVEGKGDVRVVGKTINLN
jgi:phage gp45-like